jgi:hypothetical protein
MKNILLILIGFYCFQVKGQTCSISASTSTLCNGQSSTLTFAHDLPIGSALFWTPTSQTSNSINVAPTTTTIYSCTVTDGSNSCTSSITITVNSIPTVTSTTPGSRCDAGTVNLSATASAGIVNWFTTPTSGTSLFTGNTYIPSISTTTIFYAEASNSGCTSARTAVTGTVNPTPALSIVNNQSLCAGDNSTAIIFSSSISSATISWNNTNNAIGLASSGSGNIPSFSTINNTTSNATATISATASVNGCTSSSISVVLIIKPKPTLSVVLSQTICAGDNSSAISFSSNIAGSTFSWSNTNTLIGLSGNGNGNIAPFVTTNNSSTNANAAITASATANGCTSNSISFNITVKPKPNIANQNFSFCSSTNYTSNWTGVIPTNTVYTWNVTNNTQVIGETNNNVASAFSQTLTNLTLLNQTVVYSITPSADACVGSPFTLNLEVKPSPLANAGQDFTKTCVDNINGSSIGSSSVTGFSYSWSPSNGLNFTNISNPNANPSTSTIYTLTVTDQLSNCSAADQVVVAVNNTAPTANAGADGNITCVSNPNGITIGTSPIIGYSYAWSPITGLASSNSSSTVANPNTSQPYTLTVTNNTNGCISTDQVVVSVNKTNPTANAGIDLTKTCTQNTNGASIGSSSVSGNVYSWSPSLGLSSTSIANPTANPTVSTTYTVLITNSSNGCSNSDQVTVEVNQTPPLAGAGSDFTKTCISNVFGNSIGMSALPNVNYSWSPSTGLTASNIANPVANPTSTTTYELTATSSINGCTATDQVVVSVNQNAPLSNAGSDFTKTCVSNLSGNTIGINPISGITYSWLPSTGLTSNNIANPIANPSQTTLYTLTSTDVVNGCTSSDQVLVTVNNSTPTAYAGLDATITCNQNTNGAVIGMPPVSGITYSWTPNNGLTSSNQSEVIANPNVNTTYTLTATNTANGCVSSDAVSVNIDITPPLVNAGNDLVICQGEQVLLNGTSNGVQVNWAPSFLVQNPNQLSTEGNISGTTTFTLTATANNGCMAQDYVTAQISIVPSSGLNTSYEICQNETLDLIVNSGVTCSWSGIYTGVGNSVSLGGLESGLLNLNLTNNDGCAASETISVVVNPIPYPIISGAQAVCQNSYWEKYSVPSTSNELAWSVNNGELMSFSNANDAIVHWGLGTSGIINITETISQTGCTNNYSYEVLLDNSIALDTAEVLQLSSNVLYTPQDYTFMNWGYQSIQTNIPVSIGVYSQYCNFPNFDPSQNYYWVEIGDGNGCVTKSYFNNPIFTADLEHITSQHIQVFPNPTSGFVTIETGFSEFNFEIITMEGQVLKSGKGSYSIDLTDFDYTPGIYYLKISSNGSFFKHKIIKL